MAGPSSLLIYSQSSVSEVDDTIWSMVSRPHWTHCPWGNCFMQMKKNPRVTCSSSIHVIWLRCAMTSASGFCHCFLLLLLLSWLLFAADRQAWWWDFFVVISFFFSSPPPTAPPQPRICFSFVWMEWNFYWFVCVIFFFFWCLCNEKNLKGLCHPRPELLCHLVLSRYWILITL